MSRISEYWIRSFNQLLEPQAIASTEDIELDLLRAEVVNLIDDQFIMEATEYGIARRELILGIQPFADDTLETRRFRISTKWRNLLPYTQRQLEAKLTEIVGEGGFTIVIDHAAYTLTVTLNLGNKRMFADAQEVVENMVPANLVVMVTLGYNRHLDLIGFTHAQLATMTHQQIREEIL